MAETVNLVDFRGDSSQGSEWPGGTRGGLGDLVGYRDWI